MSKIETVILPQNFEFIRDRIAEILIDEFAGQAQITGSYEDYDVKVYTERTIPYDQAEGKIINVSFDEAGWANKHQGNAPGTYVFFIDCFVSSKSTIDGNADQLSNILSQRLAGVCRSILENSIYKTLGFQPGFISRTICSALKFGKPNAVDMHSANIARLSFMVYATELTDAKIPNLIEGYDTTVKVNNTNKGYFYQGENY